MPKFKKGDPQLTFTRKDGKKFTKTYHSVSASKRALKGWKANGGKTVKVSRFNK